MNTLEKDTLDSARFFVRDTDLGFQEFRHYKTGQVLLEKAYVDCSDQIGKPITNTRFLIFSNHMVDFRAYEQDTDWSLFVANKNGRFLILDEYSVNDKTQFTLLHLVEDARWRQWDCECKDLIEKARKCFDEALEKESVASLSTRDWLHRCEFPIGIDPEGELFDPNETLEDCLVSYNQISFREVYHQFVYFRMPAYLDNLKDIVSIEGMDGFIAYGYVDNEKGLMFEICASAKLTEDYLNVNPISIEHRILMDNKTVVKAPFLVMNQTEIDFTIFDQRVQRILQYFENDEIEQVRNIELMDGCRHIDFPDDVQVILVSETVAPELVWVRTLRIGDHRIEGMLLNEPEGNFGVHQGDAIDFRFMQLEEDMGCVKIFDEFES